MVSNNSFFDTNPENDFNGLSDRCILAYNQGNLQDEKFSEEEFEYLINFFIDELEDDIVYQLSLMSYKQHPYSFELTLRYADILMSKDLFSDALLILNSLKSSYPNNNDILFLLGKCAMRMSNRTEALSLFKQAISLADENFIDIVLSISQEYIDIFEYKTAIEFLLEGEKIESKNIEILNDIAFCYERTNDLSLSLEYYNRYLDLDPFNDNVWFNVGTIYARDGVIDRAEEAFDYAVAINPNNSSALYNQAILYINSSQYDKGIDSFNDFLKLEPDNLFAIIGIADAYIFKEKYDQALSKIHLALSIAPDSIEANSGAAYLYILKQSYYESLPYIRKIGTDPSTDYSFISQNLLKAYNETSNKEFLVYYVISLYKLGDNKSLYIYLQKLIDKDYLYLNKLYELLPEIKKNKSILKKINILKKESES